MVEYLNYTNPENITSFPGAMDYAGTIMQESIGHNLYTPMILLLVFIAFTIVSFKFNAKVGFVYSTFMTSIVAFLLVAGQMLEPQWLIFCLIGFVAAVFLSWGLDR